MFQMVSDVYLIRKLIASEELSITDCKTDIDNILENRIPIVMVVLPKRLGACSPAP